MSMAGKFSRHSILFALSPIRQTWPAIASSTISVGSTSICRLPTSLGSMWATMNSSASATQIMLGQVGKLGTHMFYSTKDSPILQASISECVENVQQRFYGKDPHFPTGPSVLGRAVANYSADLKIQIGEYLWLRRRRNKYILPGTGVIGRGKVGGRFLGGVSGVQGGNNYNVMWRDGTIYESEDLMRP